MTPSSMRGIFAEGTASSSKARLPGIMALVGSSQRLNVSSNSFSSSLPTRGEEPWRMDLPLKPASSGESRAPATPRGVKTTGRSPEAGDAMSRPRSSWVRTDSTRVGDWAAGAVSVAEEEHVGALDEGAAHVGGEATAGIPGIGAVGVQ